MIQQKMIGDVLASTVICESIKYHFPDALVHFVAYENTLPVLLNNPHIDKVIIFGNELRESKWAFYKFLKSLGKEKYFAVIDAYGKLESNLISLFTTSKYKISHYKSYTRWIYTHTVVENLNPDGRIPLAIENRLALLQPILDRPGNFLTSPKIFLKESEIREASESVKSIKNHPDQKLIMIGILGSSGLKTYPPKYIAEVLNIICDQVDAKLLFNYIPSQKEEAQAIYNKCNEKTKAQIDLDFYASSLRKFIALLSQCNALIGNEGGAVNMAKALGVPTFCIFSPFIIKGAWHSENKSLHYGIHLSDYYPQKLEKMDNKEIKRNIVALYASLEPKLFKEPLLEFLKKYCQ
ncbi:glycosyltransferase family 9 protein [Maribacter halichondriae]|uniref:glycosyltransferase family 9 protein n=1 Tax=Maribacter halichondriae TaxID=2980554 RepID=UPI002358AA23|nr:glycosyltransferase family 9 protein [Maribacter sp. Hal144]